MNAVPQAAFQPRLLRGWLAGAATVSITLAVTRGKAQKGLLRTSQNPEEIASRERSGQYNANSRRQGRPGRS